MLKINKIVNLNRLFAALHYNKLMLVAFAMAIISTFIGEEAIAFTLLIFMGITLVKVYEVYGDAYELITPSVKGFRPYQGKPVVRLAYEITEADTVVKGTEPSTSEICIAGTWYSFKHYVAVKAGDYVVFLNDKEIYHCERAVFLERNEV